MKKKLLISTGGSGGHTIPAIILYGIAKSGLGGSMTLISVPLMTIVMPLNQAL